MGWAVGVDVGGTHTDLVLLERETGRMVPLKVPTTPANLTDGIMSGLTQLFERMGPIPIERMILGTTAGTNAVIERRGAKTALVTTAGFGDMLFIARQQRPRLYDFFVEKTPPLIRRRDVFEVQERILYDGTVVQPVVEAEVRALAAELAARRYRAVAICLLHAYAFSEHERQVFEILAGSLPGVAISLSSVVAPEIREYERCNTTLVDAYLKPLLTEHFAELEQKLRQQGIPELFIMQSSGGLMRADEARRRVVTTVNSGPAGGVAGGAYLSALSGVTAAITLDVGGTSADIAIVWDSRPATRSEFELQAVPGAHTYLATGLPIKTPSVDVNPIGAGGGSIAWLDQGGILKVGPESAGSVPGPACYGRGGSRPTVTDAHVVLGRIGTERPLGGYLQIQPELARQAIEVHLARPMRVSVEEAAQGIIAVVNSNMTLGTRVISVDRGVDPREFTLVPFGGAGSLHAVELAEELGIAQVLVPPHPGAVSALGLLIADVKQFSVRTLITRVGAETAAALSEVYADLERDALDLMQGHGLSAKQVELIRTADARYVGQGYELAIAIPGGSFDEQSMAVVIETFHQAHERHYGYRRLESEVEVVNLRLEAVGPTPKPPTLRMKREGSPDLAEALLGSRSMVIDGQRVNGLIYDRAMLKPGHVVAGLAVIEDLTSTIYLPPGSVATVDEGGNLMIRVGDGEGRRA
jgi:N-methylhydantoinase A